MKLKKKKTIQMAIPTGAYSNNYTPETEATKNCSNENNRIQKTTHRVK